MLHAWLERAERSALWVTPHPSSPEQEPLDGKCRHRGELWALGALGDAFSEMGVPGLCTVLLRPAQQCLHQEFKEMENV